MKGKKCIIHYIAVPQGNFFSFFIPPSLAAKYEFKYIKTGIQYLTFSDIKTTFTERARKAFKKGFYKKITIDHKNS